MNWNKTLQDISAQFETFDRAAFFSALARDTVYLPSELAARVLPIDPRRDTPTWIPVALAADLRAPAH